MADFRHEQLKHIAEIEKAVSAFQDATQAAVYTAIKEQEAENRQSYTDFKPEAAERMKNQAAERIAENLRRRIKNARKDLTDTARFHLQHMKDDFTDQVSQIPETGSSFVNALRVYNEFGVQMTAEDVHALAALANGSLLALRALSAVAAKSGIRVNIPAYANYANLAAAFEKAAERAGTEDLLSYPLYVQAEGGTIQALTGIAAFTAAMDGLHKMQELIKAEGVTIDTGHGGEYVSEEEKEKQERKAREAAAAAIQTGNTAEETAAEIGKATARTAEAARNAVDRYRVRG